jgi:DNA-directed RNA polymerase beta' subunit
MKKQPKYMYNVSDNTIYTVYKDGKDISKYSMSAEDIKAIFDNLPIEDIELIGLNVKNIMPSSLIITVLPVMPPKARPAIISDASPCDDDLTIQYFEIAKANTLLGEITGKCDVKYQRLVQNIKFRIKCLMDNAQGKSRHINGRPMKGIKERLTGKDGIIRSNLMGKRVNQSARTVIGPDPTLRVDELGVPREIASILTVPIPVCSFNYDSLLDLVYKGKANTVVRNGNRANLKYALYTQPTSMLHGDILLKPVQPSNNTEHIVLIRENADGFIKVTPDVGHNGTIYRCKPILNGSKPVEGDFIERDGVIIKYEIAKKKDFELQIGDIVHRHLQNGDVLLLNRQPTLHKGSMMAHKVVILDAKTFRLNLATTKSYNADFDGDEMNAHSCASYPAISDMQNIASVPNHIISPQSSKSNISIVQDTLIGIYKLTRGTVVLEKRHFQQLVYISI